MTIPQELHGFLYFHVEDMGKHTHTHTLRGSVLQTKLGIAVSLPSAYSPHGVQLGADTHKSQGKNILLVPPRKRGSKIP